VKHFSPIEWVDFVRNVVTAEQRVPMQEHLDQDCGICLKTVKTWATMVEFARREPFYEPPTGAVRNAESYFFPFSLALKESAGVRILRHVFDSCDLGVLEGIRGSGFAPRQLMYNLDSVFIDLRIEQKLGSDWMALTGQVMDAQLTEGILEEIPVVLFRKSDTALQTTTNRFGEFHFSFAAIERPGLRLSMKDIALLLLLPEDLPGTPMT
jgi:hypothetical protein